MSRLRDPVIAAGVALALLMAVILGGALLRVSLMSSARAKAEARLNAGQLGAAIESGSDAVTTLSTRAAADAAGDALTLENDRAIHAASGANAPVDPALRAAGLAGLCRRAAYSHHPRCLQFTPAR